MAVTILPVFQNLTGQTHASSFLSAAIAAGPSHAYIFLGPRGSGRLPAALMFAAALCCRDQGCGVCPSCEKAARGAHPDIEVIRPAGRFVTVDQMREINRGLHLHPYEGEARVVVFTDAQSFNSEAANAFLKSLEEPPAFVYFLLLASAREHVLPTLVSRCQTVRFTAVPAAEIGRRLLEQGKVRPAEAAAYARLAGGNLEMAMNLATNPELAARRRRYMAIAANVSSGAWEGGAAQMAAEIEGAAQEAAEAEVGASAATAALPEGFTTTPRKKQEEEGRRQLRAARQREVLFALDVLDSWLRDLMVSAAGAPEAIINLDYELEIDAKALPSKLQSYSRALDSVRNARAKLGYNIDIELALAAMFLDLQEVF